MYIPSCLQIGLTQLEVFTLTLSLKGEGISELRKSYPVK